MKIEKIDLYQTVYMRIDEISRSTEYRMDEQFQNCQFSEPIFDFINWKNSRSLLILQFKQFQKFAIREIPKMSNLGISENVSFGKLQKFSTRKVSKIFQTIQTRKSSNF